MKKNSNVEVRLDADRKGTGKPIYTNLKIGGGPSCHAEAVLKIEGEGPPTLRVMTCGRARSDWEGVL